MSFRKSHLIVVLMTVFWFECIEAAEIFLKNQSEPIVGEIAAVGNGELIIKLEGGEQLKPIKQSDVASIVFDKSAQPPTSSEAALRFHGSNTVGEKLVPGLVDGFVESRGGQGLQWLTLGAEVEKRLVVKSGGAKGGIPSVVDVYAHGSSTSFQALKEEATDIGMSSRPIKQKSGKSSGPGAISKAPNPSTWWPSTDWRSSCTTQTPLNL